MTRNKMVLQHNVVGYTLENGRVVCAECIKKYRKPDAVAIHYEGDYTEWSMTCEDCEESVLELEEEFED